MTKKKTGPYFDKKSVASSKNSDIEKRIILSKCRICGNEIGYNEPFVVDPLNYNDYVHEGCIR